MEVLPKRDGRAYDAAQVEDGPEDADKSTLLALRRVAHHERTLRSPEQACADAQDCSCGDDERARFRVNVDGPVYERSV